MDEKSSAFYYFFVLCLSLVGSWHRCQPSCGVFPSFLANLSTAFYSFVHFVHSSTAFSFHQSTNFNFGTSTWGGYFALFQS